MNDAERGEAARFVVVELVPFRCNCGQQHGPARRDDPDYFTHEDVRRLRARANLTADPSEAEWCLSLAGRIAATLPPEKDQVKA